MNQTEMQVRNQKNKQQTGSAKYIRAVLHGLKASSVCMMSHL